VPAAGRQADRAHGGVIAPRQRRRIVGREIEEQDLHPAHGVLGEEGAERSDGAVASLADDQNDRKLGGRHAERSAIISPVDW